MAQKENTTANALMDQILNGNSQGEQSEEAIVLFSIKIANARTGPEMRPIFPLPFPVLSLLLQEL